MKSFLGFTLQDKNHAYLSVMYTMDNERMIACDKNKCGFDLQNYYN